jgi:cysteine synthase A
MTDRRRHCTAAAVAKPVRDPLPSLAIVSVSPPACAVSDNLADLVGNTPMVRLLRVAPECGAELIGKLEAYNPAGSVKDRIGISMLDAAEAEGRIEPGRTTIVEATSGNTGIALAFVCAARGYDLVLTMPQGMSREREGLLRLYGARVETVESMGGMNEAVEAARRVAGERGDAYIPDQFSNPANPEIHRRTTAEEIWRDLDGRVDAFIAGVGTGGTITGAGGRLKERKTARACARSEGVLVGISAGAALSAAIQVGSRPEFAGKRIAVIMPDSGERYVSTPFFAP